MAVEAATPGDLARSTHPSFGLRHWSRPTVLDRGPVAESGTHAQLLRKGGLYAEMWTRQQSEREEEEAKAAE